MATTTTLKEVRLGVIGLGNMGWYHAQYLRNGEIPRCRLAAVCDINPERLAVTEAPKKYASSADLIRSGEVDAVLVATPHYDHTTIAIDAMANGIHVLTEKPIAVHKADAERMIAAHAKRPDLVFGAMFQMRTNPVFRKIKHLVASGELGELRRSIWIITDWFRSAAYYASGGWRATWKGEGGGTLLNQCPHNLDLLTWVCGMPTRVDGHCHFGKYHDIEVEDDVTAYLEFANGATGVFAATTGEAPGTNRWELDGERGKLVLEHGKITFVRNEVSASEFSRTTKESFVAPPTWTIEIPAPGRGGAHQDITGDFTRAILDGTPLVAPAEEGIRSVELANAMLYSTFTAKPVTVPLDAAAYERALKERIATSKFVKKDSGSSTESDMTKSFR